MHQVAAGARPPLFAIFAGLAMMLSPKVGEEAFEVGVLTQALAQPIVGVLCRRRAPTERRLATRKGAFWTSVVGCIGCSARKQLYSRRNGAPLAADSAVHWFPHVVSFEQPSPLPSTLTLTPPPL